MSPLKEWSVYSRMFLFDSGESMENHRCLMSPTTQVWGRLVLIMYRVFLFIFISLEI